MSSLDAAHAALEQAQTLLQEVTADNARMDDFLAWLEHATERARRLDQYYRGPGQDHIATILEDDPEAVTPPVANEDTAWEAVTGSYDRMLRLLRVVTTVVTAPLDSPETPAAVE